jgi:D-hexose-6-phosphate mutarotase
MWSLENVAGEGGLDTLVFGNETSKVSLYLFGCTITSWTVNGKEKLFVSSQAIYNGNKAIRGGIPIVFPQFSQPLKEMNQHGFARNSIFGLKSHSSDQDSMTVILSLQENENTFKVWPYQFNLDCEIRLTANSLTTKLSVLNTGDKKFNCHTLLHTYLSVPHISDISVKGFQSRSYVDKLTNTTTTYKTEEATISEEVDRVVLAGGEPIGPILLINKAANKPLLEVKVSASLNSDPYPFDIVFWNPWIEKAKALADLGDEDYLHYVCIEPGTVSNWVEVHCNSMLLLEQTLTALE